MKRTFAGLLALLLLALVSSNARAVDMYDTMIVTNASGAVMYDSCYTDSRKPLALVPKGGIVLYIDMIDWGYLVGFGNYLGYIEFADLARNTYNWRVFALPSGQDYSIKPEPPKYDFNYDYYNYFNYNERVPEFEQNAVKCYANQIMFMRSGPNTKYNSPGQFPQDIDVYVYYQAPGNGVQWGCFEFWYGGLKYRAYTGMKRVDTNAFVPNYYEEYVDASIISGHKPYYGPGYEYALAGGYVPGGSAVQAIHQENGWLMFEYTLSNGDIQRAWAPPDYWSVY